MVTNIRFFSRPLKIYQIPSIPLPPPPRLLSYLLNIRAIRAPDINGKGPSSTVIFIYRTSFWREIEWAGRIQRPPCLDSSFPLADAAAGATGGVVDSCDGGGPLPDSNPSSGDKVAGTAPPLYAPSPSFWSPSSPPVALSRGPSTVTSMHHVTAFFRPEAVRTCQRCHSRFFVQPALHPPDSCKFHRGSYVCRRHPAETKCSIDGQGDNLGYYGTGKEGWAAEFWDCCGSEDPLAPGCCGDLHSPYS
eukprot:gene25725-33593_t